MQVGSVRVLCAYRILPMCAHILTQKSEEASASSASLLATPLCPDVKRNY